MKTSTYDRLERAADRDEARYVSSLLAGVPHDHPALLAYHAGEGLWRLREAVRSAERAQQSGDARSVYDILSATTKD